MISKSKEALEYLTSKTFTGGNSILETEAEICANVIKQDLERLEVLENENQILNQSVKDTYDTSQEIIYELKQENEKLKNENKENAEFYVKSRDALWDLKQQNEKLKKALEIIKNNINHLEIQIIDGFPSGNVFIGMTQQEYKLLKEVLGDA